MTFMRAFAEEHARGPVSCLDNEKGNLQTYKFPSKQKEHKAPNFTKTHRHKDIDVCLVSNP